MNPPDERNIFLSVSPSHSSGRVRLQAGVGGGTGRLSGYNYLVSSANYTPSITTALYHGPLLTHSYTSHHPTHPPSAAPRGLDKNACLPPEPEMVTRDHTHSHTPPPHDDK